MSDSLINVLTNTTTLSGLLESTKYEIQVSNVCSLINGNYIPSFFIETPTVIYSSMSSGSSAFEFISKVTLKPNGKPIMDNPSITTIYSDFTGTPARLLNWFRGLVVIRFLLTNHGQVIHPMKVL